MHHGAPRRSHPVIIDDGEDEYYYYGDGEAPPCASVRQYSDDDPSPLHLIPTTRRTYNHSPYDSDGYSTDRRIQMRSPYSPPSPPPLRDVLVREVALGVARVIPALVTLGVAKGIDSNRERNRDGGESICIGLETTNRQENQGVTPRVHISEMRKKIDMEVRKIPGLTRGEIIKAECQIAKREDLMDIFFSMDGQAREDLVRAIINGDA